MSVGRWMRTRIESPALRINLTRERRADERVAIRGTVDVRNPMESPEPVVDSVNAGLRHPAPFVLRRHCSLHDDERCHPRERGLEFRLRGEILRQLFAKQARRRDHVVRSPEATEQQVAKAAANGVADEQRSRQHRHSRGNTEHHGHIRAPVVGQAADGDLFARAYE